VLDAVPEIRRVQQRELFRAERADGLSTFDDRLDQVRRIPLRRDDVVAFGLQPGFEEFALCGFARSVRSFKGDQKAPPASGVTEVGAGAQAQSSKRVRRCAHGSANAAS
jgi:hypothetical protein